MDGLTGSFFFLIPFPYHRRIQEQEIEEGKDGGEQGKGMAVSLCFLLLRDKLSVEEKEAVDKTAWTRRFTATEEKEKDKR